MEVPKEIAEKATRYEKLSNEANELFEELESWANENGFEDLLVTGFGISQKPTGKSQSDGEYCDQVMYDEDSGNGNYYYPVEGSSKYMRVEYSF